MIIKLSQARKIKKVTALSKMNGKSEASIYLKRQKRQGKATWLKNFLPYKNIFKLNL